MISLKVARTPSNPRGEKFKEPVISEESSLGLATMQNTLPRLILVLLLTLSPTFALAKSKKASSPSTATGAQSTSATPAPAAQSTNSKTPASSSTGNSSKKATASNDGGDSEDDSEQGGKTGNSKQMSSDNGDGDQDPEQAEQESDSVVPKTQQNPFSKPDIDQLVKKQFDEDMWRIMRGGLPCLETSAVCLQQLQEKAVAQSPLLKEIDQRVQEANQKVDDAKTRNKKTISLSVFSPALQYMLGSPSSGSSTSSGKSSPGFFNRLGKLLTGNLGIINDLLSVIGTPFFENSQGGNSTTQSQAIQISDLQVRIAELQRQRAQEADNVRSKVVVALSNFDEARVEFQMSQVVTSRSIQQFQVYEMGYLRGNSDTETYLSKQNSLDHAKAQVYTSWAKMRRTLFQLKLLVLNVQDAESN